MNEASRTKARVYRNLRTALIYRGTTLRRFALDNGYPLATVYLAARGERAGVKSTKIRRELEELIK